MAKHKKPKNGSKEKGSGKGSDYSEAPEGFWRQATSVLLILLAVILIFGALGTGGVLAVGLFDWMRWLLGVIAFSLPVTLIIAAIIKVRSNQHKLARSLFWGFIILHFSAAGFAHLFIDKAESIQAVEDGMGGGFIGHITDSGILSLLNKVTGGIVLFVLAVIALHFVFRLPLTFFLKMIGLKRKSKVEPDATLAGEKTTFQLNEGVPLQRGRADFRNTSKASEVDQQEALTTIGDPGWNFPPLDLLNDTQDKADAGDIEATAKVIKDTMADFNMEVEMEGANVGPRVTQYTLRPPNGVRLTKITALENNLALNLAATSIRIEAPIPGKRAVGIEVPNRKTATVRLHSMLSSEAWKKSTSPLSIVIGKDIAGDPIVGDLDKMPHLLIAGATGSGKSVMINALLMSLLYRNSPSDLKLIMVDPKHVELTPYNGIPHLLTEVITEPTKCISALKWAVAEMDRRYNLLSGSGRKDIAGYNQLKKEEGMPYIVIVIDELADLMMLAARDVEALIVRLAQKSRAVGIHLVLATQRPSVDIITGLIKANVPARIAFAVTSNVDSRTILDQGGAEKLLGRGDMLMQTPDIAKPRRIQGAIIEEDESEKVIDYLKMERAPQYNDEIISQQVHLSGGRVSSMMYGGADSDDSLYEDAVQVVIDSGKASTSLLQRRLRVGYSRAARLMESMEEQGVIGPADGARPREVLISSIDQLELTGPDSLIDDQDEFVDEEPNESNR